MENKLPVTLFRGLMFAKNPKYSDLESVLMDIKSDKWKTRVMKCWTDLKAKDWLPVFTPTGTFTHRSIKGLEHYNGVICLDIDHVEDPAALKEKTMELSFVRAAYITPSGKGLKVIVLTDGTQETYNQAEEQVATAFLNYTGFARDNRCKDIARIQYISYDPELYYKPDSTTFHVEPLPVQLEIPTE